MFNHLTVLDCTLRDGGYYNDWSFNTPMINDYLSAMAATGIQTVELGLRSLKNESFKGPCAFTTDSFVNNLIVPDSLTLGVMINASELISHIGDMNQILLKFFPCSAIKSKVKLVRIACHVHELSEVLPATTWLKDNGYIVGVNLMQIAECAEEKIKALAAEG